jgi:hypothetical protein
MVKQRLRQRGQDLGIPGKGTAIFRSSRSAGLPGPCLYKGSCHMPENTPRLALPLIQPAQAQKHITHNQAIERLDMIVQLVVEGFGIDSPPVDPAEGSVWALGPSPVGVWAGHPLDLASFRDQAWAFAPPAVGWLGFGPTGLRRFNGAEWVSSISADDLQILPGLGVNAVADASNRLVVASPASLFSHEGAGHQVKVNKAAPGDTASLLFQSDWSGRAEMGLAGTDDFSVKVSADGSLFNTALTMASATGQVSVPMGLRLGDGSATDPSLGFISDGGTGLALCGPGQLGLVTGGVLRGKLANDSLQLEVPARIRSDVTPAFYDTTIDSTLFLVQGGNPGQNSYGASLGFSKIGSANRMSAAMAVKQTSSDADQCGLAFFTHSSSNTGANLIEQMVIRHDGRVGVGVAEPSAKLDVGGTLNASNLTRNGSVVFARNNILGIVSQTAGVPGGAVIERGTTANGDYVRFADGTMRCIVAALSAPDCTTADGAVFRSADLIWTFPSTFISAPVVTGAADNLDCWLSTAAPGTGAATVRVRSSISVSGSVPVRLVAHGRWF